MTSLLRLAAIALVATTTACLSTDDPGDDAIPIESTTFAPALGVDLGASTKTEHGAYYRDIAVGTGSTIATGQSVSVRYTVWLANGTQIDSNLTRPDPLTFTFGVGGVIRGMDEALIGAKVGGKRQLIIPPSLGYGAYDYGDIPGNSVLVFTVEVVSAQ